MRLGLPALLLAAAAMSASAQEPAPGQAIVAGPDGKAPADAHVVLLPAATPAETIARAIVGADLVAAVRAGTTLLAAGETVGRTGRVALDLPADAVVRPAPGGVADLSGLPAGEWLAVAGAPGFVPAGPAVRVTGATDTVRLAVVAVDATCATASLSARWADGLPRTSRLTLRAVPLRTDRPRWITWRDGDKRCEVRTEAPAAGADPAPVVETAGSTTARLSVSGLCLTVPIDGKPLALLASPDLDLHVWGGSGARAARLGVLRAGGPKDRVAQFLRPEAGNGTVTVKVLGPDGAPVKGAMVWLFPEGTAGFEIEGLGARLADPTTCLAALREARQKPLETLLTETSGRHAAVDGTAAFPGHVPGESRIVVEADGYAQRVAPTVDVSAEGAGREASVRLVALARYVGVLRVNVVDPAGGPFQGRVSWAISGGPGSFSDHGATVARESGLVLAVPPVAGLSLVVSTGERGGLAVQVKDLAARLGAPTDVVARLMPPEPKER